MSLCKIWMPTIPPVYISVYFLPDILGLKTYYKSSCYSCYSVVFWNDLTAYKDLQGVHLRIVKKSGYSTVWVTVQSGLRYSLGCGEFGLRYSLGYGQSGLRYSLGYGRVWVVGSLGYGTRVAKR